MIKKMSKGGLNNSRFSTTIENVSHTGNLCLTGSMKKKLEKMWGFHEFSWFALYI